MNLLRIVFHFRVLCLIAALLFLGWNFFCSSRHCQAAPVEDRKFQVAGVYFFGTDVDHFDAIKESMPVKVGDEYQQSAQPSVETAIRDAVKKTLDVQPTEVAVIDCGMQTWNIYVGLPGKSVTKLHENERPTKNLSLPKEALKIYQEKGEALQKVLKEKGGCLEDTSKGYSLSDDPEMHSVQLRVRSWAIDHDELIRDVLRMSRNAKHRAVAADFLGMEDPSTSQIQLLVDAASDESLEVRNNATRALGCIANSQTSLAGSVPCDKFIAMLNSGIWVDRNKGMFVLSGISRRDPSVISRVRDEAFQSLCDIAQWDPPHAGTARFMLAKIAGWSEWREGRDSVEKLIEVARIKYKETGQQVPL